MVTKAQLTKPSVQILRASDVSIPIYPPTPSAEMISPELLKVRSDFLDGKEVPLEGLRMMLRASEGGGTHNGNCGIC